MKKIFLVVFTILMAETLFSQVSTSMVIKKESSLIINGATNISKFKLTLDGEDFPGPVHNFLTTFEKEKITLSTNKISLDVKRFHSTNILALNGFLKLIESEKFPYLDIELNQITQSQVNLSNFKGLASVKITLTGVTRVYDIPFNAYKNGNELSGDGLIRLTIKDFGLTPPVAMMGLVRISEWIEINIKFSLLFS